MWEIKKILKSQGKALAALLGEQEEVPAQKHKYTKKAKEVVSGAVAGSAAVPVVARVKRKYTKKAVAQTPVMVPAETNGVQSI